MFRAGVQLSEEPAEAVDFFVVDRVVQLLLSVETEQLDEFVGSEEQAEVLVREESPVLGLQLRGEVVCSDSERGDFDAGSPADLPEQLEVVLELWLGAQVHGVAQDVHVGDRHEVWSGEATRVRPAVLSEAELAAAALRSALADATHQFPEPSTRLFLACRVFWDHPNQLVNLLLIHALLNEVSRACQPIF